jgi:choline kinase
MKALILAAGLGSRLAPLTDKCPKALIPVNGKPILIKQIENLLVSGIKDITVIAGYKAEVLSSEISSLFPEVNIIINQDYSTTNNMYSAYLGRESMGNDDFLMLNGDVFFDSSVIKTLCEHDSQNAIVTDIGRYLEESMKVIKKNGRLIKISKAITKDDAYGTSIDIYKFSRQGGKIFFDKCEMYIKEKQQLNLWSEVALNEILSVIRFTACPLKGRWFEIDSHDDLLQAEKLFAG